jgi:hypothetical protein
LSAPLVVKISAGSDRTRAEVSREPLEWISFGFTEAAVCDALKEAIDRSGLYIVARRIYQTLRGCRGGGKFGGSIALYGISRIHAECGQVEHDPRRAVVPDQAPSSSYSLQAITVDLDRHLAAL